MGEGVKMKILFVCKYNAFRSPVAEEYFKKINKKIKVFSRGIIMGGNADGEQRKLAKQILGINIGKRKPVSLSLDDLTDADLIVVVADDVPKIIFNYQLEPIIKKIVMWEIKDEQKMNKKNIKKIIFMIKEKVDELNKELGR
jgi:protein-tyrosine-phosphatase